MGCAGELARPLASGEAGIGLPPTLISFALGEALPGFEQAAAFAERQLHFAAMFAQAVCAAAAITRHFAASPECRQREQRTVA